jgi:hypothetical protein
MRKLVLDNLSLLDEIVTSGFFWDYFTATACDAVVFF